MSPMDRSRYPENWDEMARACKEAAGWKCEHPHCGIGHMEDGTMGSCLTVHHVNHDPENPAAVLIALCARCHLKIEAEYRVLKWFDEMEEAGQLTLFGPVKITGGLVVEYPDAPEEEK